MESGTVIVIAVVVLGLVFEFVNGFHDAANAIATVVATRVLTPLQALLMAGTLNLVGALAGTAVAVQQAKVLVAAAEHLVTALKDLEKLDGLEPHWIKIHTLENEGDQLFRTAVGNLFAETTDPVEIIKWKDLHALIEVAIDRCEDVANIVETIVVKHK